VLAPWPPDAPCPQHFSLLGRASDAGSFRSAWLDAEAELNARESQNLLYVALTRAEQALIVSGDGAKNAWLDRVDSAWRDAGHPADLPHASVGAALAETPHLPRMHAPAIGERTKSTVRTAASARGEYFHACLEQLAPPGIARDLPTLARQLGIAEEARIATEHAARTLLAQPHLQRYFTPTQYLHARNELDILDHAGRPQRLDRVVEFADAVWVLDYKTGADALQADDDTLHRLHRAQLDSYRQLLVALYPGKLIHAALLLGDGRMIEIL
jgi:ATP-dependent helicase/nuclease subunit A